MYTKYWTKILVPIYYLKVLFESTATLNYHCTFLLHYVYKKRQFNVDTHARYFNYLHYYWWNFLYHHHHHDDIRNLSLEFDLHKFLICVNQILNSNFISFKFTLLLPCVLCCFFVICVKWYYFNVQVYWTSC